jgi:electron transfer flavoprotein beta subunit
MNILVCVSHVPDTTTRINVAGDGKSMDPAGVKFILNPYDEFAVEEALRLRDKFKGEVTVISVGTDSAKEAIRQALAMGADKGILIKGEKQDSRIADDAFQVASMLAGAIKPLNPDLISELLNLPAATVAVSLSIEGNKATVEKEVEGGREVIELTMPCIVAAQKGLNEPRYPSLPNIMKAKQKPIQEIAGTTGAARTEILQMTKPEKKRANKILKADGNGAATAQELARLLHEDAKVI